MTNTLTKINTGERHFRKILQSTAKINPAETLCILSTFGIYQPQILIQEFINLGFKTIVVCVK
jgi:hypothetical protein